MSSYKRNQQGQHRNSGLERHEQLERKGEDIYGDGEDYSGEGYRNPDKLPFPIPSAPQDRASVFRYGDRRNESRNYRRGGYYGGPFDRQEYDRERNRQTMGFGQDYQRIDERDEGMGGWWEPDRSRMEAYRYNRERQHGMHRGKGPRDYQRSDERINEDINDRLGDDSFIDASDVEVTVRDGEVILSGTVESRETKRTAEDIAESVSGVKNVENRLRIKQNTGHTNADDDLADQTLARQSPTIGEVAS
jgi:osmotically-inducible protein OsmY